MATHLIVAPLARVFGAIGPEINAIALLHAVFEETVVVAAIRPDFDALAILLIVRCDLASLIERLQVVLDIEADVLSEDAEVCLTVLLPEAFIDLVRVWCSEHTKSAGLAVDPVAFECASIRPQEFAISALDELVVNDGLLGARTRLWRVMIVAVGRLIAGAINGCQSDLAHVLE